MGVSTGWLSPSFNPLPPRLNPNLDHAHPTSDALCAGRPGLRERRSPVRVMIVRRNIAPCEGSTSAENFSLWRTCSGKCVLFERNLLLPVKFLLERAYGPLWGFRTPSGGGCLHLVTLEAVMASRVSGVGLTVIHVRKYLQQINIVHS